MLRNSSAFLLVLLAGPWTRAIADCSLTALGITPLDDLGPRTYLGFQAGLYPRGLSVRPPALDAAAIAVAARIQPLDSNGNPSSTGRIVLLSTGMSNTTQEFASAGPNAFKPRADADNSKNPQLVIVDGAQGGKDATQWLDPNSTTWTTVNQRLASAGVTAAQVQVAWIKHAIAGPATLGAFPAHAQTLQNNLAIIARNLKTKYPNIKLCYVASRTRAYTNTSSSLNPEPYAFESGFSVKWVIEDQIAGRNNLNWDSTRGAVVAPLLCWGPYLWADGTTPRSDGFTWLCSDLQSDFTHPSYPNGVTKVATQLLAFFKSDATAAPWFLKSTMTGQPPTCTAGASVTSGAAPLPVSFTASASDPDGSIVSYQWTFGDGTFSTVQNPSKTFPAPGNYNARLTVTDNDGNTVIRTIPIVVKLSFAGWQQIHFTAAEIANPTVSGESATPAGDGVTNLAKYAMGLSPKTPGASGMPVAVAAGDHLTLTYTRASAASDVTVTSEVTSDLTGSWTSGPSAISEQVLSDDGVVETILATDLTAMAGTSNRFMRLRIQRVN